MLDKDKSKEQLLKELTELRQQYREIEKHEKRFRELVETTGEWLWEVNEKAVYIYSNYTVRGMLGYEPEEIIGKTPFDFMSPEEAKGITDIFDTLVAERKPLRALENRIIHKDGHQVVVETNAVPLFDDEGNFQGYRGLDRNITERKLAEEELRHSNELLEATVAERTAELQIKLELIQKQQIEQQQLISIIENSHDFIGIATLDGRELYLNEAGYKMVGRPEDDEIGSKLIRDYLDENTRIQYETEIVPTVMREGFWQGESRLKNFTTGQLIDVEATISIVKDPATGAPFCLTAIQRDITERTQKNSELREKLDFIEKQRDVILELSTPAIQIWDGILILPLIGAIDSKRASQIMQNTLDSITKNRARQVIIDITGVPVVDTEVANHLIKTVQAAKLVGAQCMLVGISSELAQTLVFLGLDLAQITTFATLQDGLQEALLKMKFEIVSI